MKVVILIDLDENYLIKEIDDVYTKLKGYQCEMKPIRDMIPTKWLREQEFTDDYDKMSDGEKGYLSVKNTVIDQLLWKWRQENDE